MILESVLEYSGLIKGVHYETQESYKDEEGRIKRPDVVIKLPQDRTIIIDSKVSLNSYDEFIRAESEEEKRIASKALMQAFREHIDILDSKDSQVNTEVGSNDILGTYISGNASLVVNKDLSFEYSSINESNGNLCLISDEKFKLDNGNLIWNSQEYNCKMKISNVTKDTIDIATNGDECFSYCGMNAFIIEGKFKKNKASQASQQTTQDKNIERLPQVEIYNISPKGKLADIYNLGSKYTDIQRDNMEKELKGKIVRWELPVYEVSKISDKKYKISTGTGNPFKESYVSTVIEISVKDSKEAEYIESLMTDNMINIQGKITGVSLRRIMIKEASLY
jgi:hypothetical protein